MFSGLFQPGVLPIGVSVDPFGVRLAQLRKLRSGYGLVDAAWAPLDPKLSEASPAERAAAVREAIERKLEGSAFLGKRCVVSASDDLLKIRSVRQPRMPRDETDRAIRLEGAERLGFRAEERVELGWLMAGEARQGDDVRDELIVVGGTSAAMEQLVDAVAASGLRPVALEPAFVATGRAYSRTHRRASDRDTVRIVVDVGRRATSVIVLRGPDVVFYKGLTAGGARLDAAAGEALEVPEATARELRRQRMTGGGRAGDGEGLSPEVDRAMYESARPLLDELANEAALCLRYYTVTFRGRRPEAVIASGEEAREPGLSEALGSALGAPGQVGRPLEGVEPGEQSDAMDRRGDMAEWAAAVGLTLREDESARAATPEGEAARSEESAERITDLPARGISSNAAARARREAA